MAALRKHPTKKQNLIREDWDFRTVRTEQASAAAMYEYARSMPLLGRLLTTWFDNPVEKLFVLPTLEERLTALKFRPGTSIREILEAVDLGRTEQSDGSNSRASILGGLWRTLIRAFVTATGCADFDPASVIAGRMWMFPERWLKIKWSPARPAPALLHHRVQIDPIVDLDDSNWTQRSLIQYVLDDRAELHLSVDMFASPTELARSFIAIVEERKRCALEKARSADPPLPKEELLQLEADILAGRRIGRGDKAQHLLKILAAHRLNRRLDKTGVSTSDSYTKAFNKLQDKLKALEGKDDEGCIGNSVLPIYGEKGWGNAVEECQSLLTKQDLIPVLAALDPWSLPRSYYAGV